MLSRNGKHLPDPKPMKIIHQRRLPVRIGFVHREKNRTAGLPQQSGEFNIWRGEFRTSITYQNDRSAFIQRDSRLAENLRRNEILFLGQDSARINDAQLATPPFGIAVQAVASDAGFIANDGAARAHDAVE